MKAYDLKGRRFGKLLALKIDYERTEKSSNHCRYWWCRCDCGNVVSVRATTLTAGEKTSCGCDRPVRKAKTRNSKYYVHKNPPSALCVKYGCLFCADAATCDFNCKYADFLGAYGSYANYDRAAKENIYKLFNNFIES